MSKSKNGTFKFVRKNNKNKFKSYSFQLKLNFKNKTY